MLIPEVQSEQQMTFVLVCCEVVPEELVKQNGSSSFRHVPFHLCRPAQLLIGHSPPPLLALCSRNTGLYEESVDDIIYSSITAVYDLLNAIDYIFLILQTVFPPKHISKVGIPLVKKVVIEI